MTYFDTRNGESCGYGVKFMREERDLLVVEVAKLREALQEISNSRYTEATAMDLIEIEIGALE